MAISTPVVAKGSDYIEGVDDVIERDIIDSISNHYGDLLLNFLIDCNFCMLNGRVKGKNEFTHVSHRGRSVVDYVLIPHEQIINVKSMNVCLMTETVEKIRLMDVQKYLIILFYHGKWNYRNMITLIHV